jgi:hypothetical protein
VIIKDDAKSLAVFIFKNSAEFSKQQLGEFFGDENQFNIQIDPGKFLFVAGPVEPEHRRGDAVLPAVLPAAGGGPEGRQGHAALRPEVLQGQPGFGLLACGCGIYFELFDDDVVD